MKRSLVAGALAVIAVGCGTQSESLVSEASSSLKSRSEIRAELAAMPEGENVIWSAASLDNLLVLLGEGFDDSRKALLETYLQNSVRDQARASSDLQVKVDGLVVQSANNIWAQDSVKFKPSYLQYLSNFFDGLRPESMDVTQPAATASKMNQWIAERTNNMITDVVKPDMITADLVAMLANALYFKGDWKEQFDPANTSERPFTMVSRTGIQKTKTAATMMKADAELQVAQQDGNVTIRLPYKGDTHAMYISFAAKQSMGASFAPRITEVDASKDVGAVYREMIVDGKAFNRDALFSDSFDLFTMPKFTIESLLPQIHATLISAGYGSLFQAGALSNLSDDPRFYLGFILQKAKIIVNEEGSEAAAVTIGGIRATSVRAPTHLQVNGPFAYAIQDEVRGVTLFEGIVRDPAAN